MGTNVVGAAARTARHRLTQIVLAVGVAAALAAGAGASPSAARAAVIAPSPTAGNSQLAAWAETGTYPVDGNLALAVDPATNTVYFGGTLSAGGLSVLNALTGKITGSINISDEIDAGAVDPATGTLYLTTPQSVDVVDPGTGKVTTSIPDGLSPGAIAVNPSTDTIYVANTSTITVIDGSTNTVTTTIDLAQGIAGLAVDPATNTLYVSNFDSGTVSVIDGATNTVTTTISGIDARPGQIAVNTVTDKIYVAGASIAVIDGKTNSLETTIDASASSGIAVDEETNTIYALDFGDQLEAINATTGQFEANFNTADDPNTAGGELAVDPAAGTIYVVTNFDDPGDPGFTTMAVINSCRSNVSEPAGSTCAKMETAFEPSAASFSSPQDGVVMGTMLCLQVCFQTAMMATADGGKSWNFIGPPLDLGIEPFEAPSSTLLFPSADNGWVFGSWHTANAGDSWQRAVPGAVEKVWAMAASKTTVYEAFQPAIGRGVVVATPIGKTRWTQVPGISGDATGLVTSGNSVFVTTATRLWASADGRVWHSYPARCPGSGYQLAGVTAASSSDVSLLCAQPSGSGQARRKEILVSTNGGRTVHLVGTAPSLGVAQGFASPPGDPSVITIAAGGTTKNDRDYWIYRSGNGGKTWATQTIESAPGESFRSLSFTTRTSGWLVLASDGAEQENVLLHTTDGGRSWHQAGL